MPIRLRQLPASRLWQLPAFAVADACLIIAEATARLFGCSGCPRFGCGSCPPSLWQLPAFAVAASRPGKTQTRWAHFSTLNVSAQARLDIRACPGGRTARLDKRHSS